MLILLLPVILQAQFITLPKDARFSFGDDPGWSAPGFNDSAWRWQQLAKSFKNDSSYGWYRIRVVIPASLKAGNGKGLKLQLGKIDDADQTWFNGKKIGETGSFPPTYQTQWEKSRLYFIPEQAVKWDQENIIAVRIYNLIGGMGMWEGPYTIEPAGWVDEVDVTHVITDTKSTGFSTKINFTNKSVNPFIGSIRYRVTDKAGKNVIEQNKKIILKAGAGSVSSLSFDGFSPRGESVFNVSYKIKDDNSNLFLAREELHILTADLVIPVKAGARMLVENKVTNKFTATPFEQQQFTGYLHTRFTQNLQQRLLNVDEAGLIGSYLKRPGIHPWAGEHIGKYLETAVNTWKLTHDPSLKKQMDRLMFELINTQQSDGYLGTYTPDQYWTSWDVWSHKYNLHGLLAYYSVSGYAPAIAACRRIGDLLCRTFGKNPGQSDIIAAGEHKGMAATSVLDAMVELYKYTADKKYLDFCYYILDAWQQANGPKVISSIMATGKVKNVGNGKAYEMLSNYVGLIKLYQVTGDPVFLKAVELAWQDVVNTQLYITGTSSSHEYFQADGYLPASVTDNMGEGCVTTTWIQLNQQLFTITGDLKYMDQLEKSVYNHLLAAENPQTGCVSYYTPLMGKKPYTCFITCCQSSVPRGIALVPGFTFGMLNNNPAVLLYEPATYKYTIKIPGKKDVGLRLKLEGDFPETGDFMLTVNASFVTEIPLSLRVPAWCTQFTAKAGKDVYTGTPGQLLTISRKWKPGEQVKIHFDMPIQYLPGGNSYPGQFAIQRGPQVLALDKSLNTPSAYERVTANDGSVKFEFDSLVANGSLLPAGWIGKQAYTASIMNKTGRIILVPFAEASQTEGEIRVWLPLNSKN